MLWEEEKKEQTASPNLKISNVTSNQNKDKPASSNENYWAKA